MGAFFDFFFKNIVLNPRCSKSNPNSNPNPNCNPNPDPDFNSGPNSDPHPRELQIKLIFFMYFFLRILLLFESEQNHDPHSAYWKKFRLSMILIFFKWF